MLLLKYIDNFTGSNYHNNVTLISIGEITRSLVSLYGAIFTLNTLKIYYLENNLSLIQPTVNVLTKTFIYDFAFFKCKEDKTTLPHHIISFYLAFLIYYHNLNVNDDCVKDVIISIFLTEVSTIFLRIRDISKSLNIYRGNLKTINNYLFAIMFFYTRIYFYTTKIYIDDGVNKIIDKYSIEYPIFFYTPYHSIFILNLYWFFLILKIGYKEVYKNN